MKMNVLPSHASVVVVGGGIMGCSTLYHLARLGVSDAILLERNKITSGTTWHSAAQVRAQRNSKNLTRMIQYSVELYGQLEKETGQSVGWIQEGSLSLTTNPEAQVSTELLLPDLLSEKLSSDWLSATNVEVDIAGELASATVNMSPLYDANGLRMKLL